MKKTTFPRQFCHMTRINADKGEHIEDKVRRITENNEPIQDGAPEIYTDRKDGVIPAYDIRTDRFDVALEAMDKVNASKIAESESYLKPAKPEGEQGGTEENG